MANHQHALIRYATLDHCLSRFRLDKQELIERCSEAVARIAGEERRISERTFFADLLALREGVVLGRRAQIICTNCRYGYAEPGFSLFHAGDAELRELQVLLAQREQRAVQALEYLRSTGVAQEKLQMVSELLLGDPGELWQLRLDQERVQVRASAVRFSAQPKDQSVDALRGGSGDHLGCGAMYMMRDDDPSESVPLLPEIRLEDPEPILFEPTDQDPPVPVRAVPYIQLVQKQVPVDHTTPLQYAVESWKAIQQQAVAPVSGASSGGGELLGLGRLQEAWSAMGLA